MIVTIATFEESGEQLDEGMRHVQEEVVPSIRGAAGLRAAYYASAAAMPAVIASIKRLREEAGRTEPQRAPDRSERFEVFAQVEEEAGRP
ncbi:MAG: hypothetical protein E6I21_14750 [Chloroflexi bacterium]|nr:MAG: hypothetical protein E6I21_14750 [Chloroflexota bacterium]